MFSGDLLLWLTIPGALGILAGIYWLGRKFGGTQGGLWAALGAGAILVLAIIGRSANTVARLPNTRREEAEPEEPMTLIEWLRSRRDARRARR